MGRKYVRGIEIQFNWIFSIIAGALILSFFIMVAQKQYSLSTQKSEIITVNNLETAFSIVLKNPNTIQSVEMPSELSFFCTDECFCTYKYGNAELPFFEKIIFTDKKQKDRIFLWNLNFEKPFRVSSFIILINDNTKHYLVYNKDNEKEADDIIKKLPTELKIEKIAEGFVNSVKYSGEKTRFIFLKTEPSTISNSFNGKDVDAVKLESETASYYDVQNGRFLSTGSSFYSSEDNSLFAVMFSSQQVYNCQMKKLFSRLSSVSNIYSKRSDNLTTQKCQYIAGDLLKNLIFESQEQQKNLQSFGTANSIAKLITEQNERMIKQGCPEIY